MNNIPGNPRFKRALRSDVSTQDAFAIANAILALTHEQHQRNRLAAITAHTKGITLPTDLAALAEEDPS